LVSNACNVQIGLCLQWRQLRAVMPTGETFCFTLSHTHKHAHTLSLLILIRFWRQAAFSYATATASSYLLLLLWFLWVCNALYREIEKKRAIVFPSLIPSNSNKFLFLLLVQQNSKPKRSKVYVLFQST